MVIDEEKADALTNFNGKTSGRVAKTSDHNSMFVEMLLKTNPQKIERTVIFNYKDENALQQFKNITSKTKKLSNCFKTDETIDVQVEKWF